MNNQETEEVPEEIDVPKLVIIKNYPECYQPLSVFAILLLLLALFL